MRQRRVFGGVEQVRLAHGAQHFPLPAVQKPPDVSVADRQHPATPVIPLFSATSATSSFHRWDTSPNWRSTHPSS